MVESGVKHHNPNPPYGNIPYGFKVILFFTKKYSYSFVKTLIQGRL